LIWFSFFVSPSANDCPFSPAKGGNVFLLYYNIIHYF
jgi:hypothetical protein